MRLSTSTARSGVSAVVAVAAVAGYLLSSGALDPVLADGVTLARSRLGHHPSTQDAPSVVRVADWQYFDDRPEWSSVRGVPQVERPDPPQSPSRPAVAPPENPHHVQFTGPAPMRRYTLKPLGACFQPRGPGLNVQHFTVTAGKGGATVTWWDLGDPDVKKYQVAAVPDYVNVGDGSKPAAPRPTVTVTLPPPLTCMQITTTVSGLTSGAHYIFVLQSTNTSRVQANVDYQVTRAQSGTIVIG